jgi:hypothetical protein
MDSLATQARLEKLLAKSAQAEPKYPQYQEPRNTLQQVDLDPVADLITNELRISSQVEKIAKNAIKERLGWKPRKIKSDVTEQMVKRYQLSLIKPVVVDGEKYKYHPSSLTLDKVEYPDRPDILSPAQLAVNELEIEELVAAIERRRAEQADLRRQVEQNRRDFDAAYSANQVRKFKGKPQRNESQIQFDIRKAQEKNDEAERVRNEADRLRRIFAENEVNLEARIALAEEQITSFTAAIRRNRAMIDESATIEADYLAARNQIDLENAQRVDAYKADLNRLNQGKLNLTQEPDETEDEFRQRLFETGQTAWDPADVEQATATYFRSILREKLLELTRDYVLIGETLKFLTDEEVGEVELNFPRIKELFLKQFGFDNINLTVRDMGQFLRKTVAPIIKEKNTGGIGALEEAEVIAGPADMQIPAGRIDGYSKEGLRKWLDDRQFNAPLNQRIDDGRTLYEAVKADLIRARSRMEWREIFRVARLLEEGGGGEAKEELEGEGVFGRGMKPIRHELPNLIDFGRIKISPRKLYYRNTLVQKGKSGGSLNGFNNVRVSDKFSDIVLGLLQGRQPTVSDFKALDLNEKGVYDSLIKLAGLDKQVENNFGETKQHLRNRLELLEGQHLAGNSNPAIKKELHALVKRMAGVGMITHPDGQKYMESLFGPSFSRK